MEPRVTTNPTQQLRQIRYDFVLEAETPICHLSESIGNEGMLMRRKIRQPGGWANVPCLTADCLRHGLREAGAYALLDACGMLERPALGEAALRLLFAGGGMGKGDAGTINLDQYRVMCDLVPSLALLGGCAQNRINPGRMSVEDATIICDETAAMIPERVVEFAKSRYGELEGARSHVEEVQRVRMDPTLSPEKRLLLTSGEQIKVIGRLEASEKASAAVDGVAAEKEKSSMMPRKFERIAQGSLFFWRVTANTYSPLDVDTLHVIVAAFLANARVGGKRGTGHGSLRALKGFGCELARPRETIMDADPTALAPSMGKVFRDHVASRKERVIEFLSSVDA